MHVNIVSHDKDFSNEEEFKVHPPITGNVLNSTLKRNATSLLQTNSSSDLVRMGGIIDDKRRQAASIIHSYDENMRQSFHKNNEGSSNGFTSAMLASNISFGMKN